MMTTRKKYAVCEVRHRSLYRYTAVLILFSIDVLPFKINPIKENARWTWFNYNGQKSNGDHCVNVILRLRGARQHWVIVVSKNTGAK